MIDHWELLDVYKAILAVAAGIILGLEREMKDKVAGLKTITIICLGATLFGIISYKVGGIQNPTTIAAYVVSGVGFLGAGAIFKDGFTISGLTTAGIIWLSAAVGLSIGFGEFFLAATFIAASLLIIVFTPFISSLFSSKKINRQLQFVVGKDDTLKKVEIIKAMEANGISVFEKKISFRNNEFEISLEIVLAQQKLEWIEGYLLHSPVVKSFSY